jgi:hypothetical protein
MRWVRFGIAAGIALAFAPAAQAQEAPTSYLMLTYYRCAQGDVARADAIFKDQVVPLLKAAQSAGNITTYGWGKHVEGGEWRRLMLVAGPDLAKLADARDALTKSLTAPEHAKAFDEFARVCPSHDDYIWRPKASSQPLDAVARTRSPFAMSTYFVCNSHEAEADAIVAAVFAGVLNQRVKDGTIDSWNWIEHIFGGEYRRALIVDGKDEKSLLTHWATMQNDLEKAAPDLARRFDDICHGHADYIWDLSGN